MKYPIIKNSLNWTYGRDHQAEQNNLPSCAVPDQSLTVAEIMRRYAQGLPLGGIRPGIYDEDDPIPDFKRMDLSEVHDLKMAAEGELMDLKNKYEKAYRQKPAPQKQPTPSSSQPSGDKPEPAEPPAA